VWRPGRRDALLALYEAEYPVGVFSNEGGIASGHTTYKDTEGAINLLLRDVPHHIPFVLCPYFPGVTDESGEESYRMYKRWHMPAPGMLHALAGLFPGIPDEEVLVVGLHQNVSYAARNAGFEYMESDWFFATLLGNGPTPSELAEAIPF